jgi:hypothetical protein
VSDTQFVDEEELSYQFFEHLGEGLTNLLEEHFGGDSYAAACRVINWLRNDCSEVVLSELAVMMTQRRDSDDKSIVVLAYNSRTVGNLSNEFACLTRMVRDSVGVDRPDGLNERFSSLDICRHNHPPI